MTISIWRYSHLTLALVSGLFLVLAAVTGIVLAFEPMQSAIKPYRAENLSTISLAETLEVLASEYDEVLTLEVDANDFLLAEVVTKTGESKSVFVHPKTGKILGEPQPQHPIFQFATNLHRSLFLKSVGRFFVGVVSFLLCLIAITGLLLIIKRQGGIAKLFSKVQKDYVALRYHVILGRWFLLPIIIVAATGVYLSAEKFSLLPPTSVTHAVVEPEVEVDMAVLPKDFRVFKDISMDEFRKLTFPFSELPEDYFELALQNREIYVHQYSGELLSERYYPFAALASRWSLVLHTGQGSILWSVVLLLVSASMLFFIYSGFVMWRRRSRGSSGVFTGTDKDECSHIILVGSETGSTFAFAEVLAKGLINAGKKVFLTEINAYSTYDKAEQLVFLTATYGEGMAPTNARKIASLLEHNQQQNPLSYAVVGFGSLAYPNYCQFAIDLCNLLKERTNFTPVVPLYKIHDQSFEAFQNWSNGWAASTGLRLSLADSTKKPDLVKQTRFEVALRTDLNADDTFLLQLKPEKRLSFQSGDLWEFVPETDSRPRWYSVAKYQDDILLSIKKHEFGICSQILSKLAAKQTVVGGIKKNPHFHFPKNARSIILIANGTGIAPFLGMIPENSKKRPLDLYFGCRTNRSLELYLPYLHEAQNHKTLTTLHVATSKERTDKVYVQDLLKRDGAVLAHRLSEGAVFMICGSISMQQGVLQVLEELALQYLERPLSDFERRGQLKMDCY